MSVSREIQLESGWKKHLQSEFEQPYMSKLRKFLVREIQSKKKVFPRPEEYFQALNWTPFDKVRVCILGQDPYHGPHQAHGLCFSVKPRIPLPPSLKNIFSELKRDLNVDYPRHGFFGILDSAGGSPAQQCVDSSGGKSRLSSEPRLGRVYRSYFIPAE